jgi:hypothetical protein
MWKWNELQWNNYRFYLHFLEIAIMSLKPSYGKGQSRDELMFASELGWLAALSFAIVEVIVSIT